MCADLVALSIQQLQYAIRRMHDCLGNACPSPLGSAGFLLAQKKWNTKKVPSLMDDMCFCPARQCVKTPSYANHRGGSNPVHYHIMLAIKPIERPMRSHTVVIIHSPSRYPLPVNG